MKMKYFVSYVTKHGDEPYVFLNSTIETEGEISTADIQNFEKKVRSIRAIDKAQVLFFNKIAG